MDFSNPQTTIAGLTNQGWKFDAESQGSCMGWQIANNLLQVTNFQTLPGAWVCAMEPTSITMAQIQAYKRLSLSLQYRIDLINPDQQAQVLLDSDAPNTRLLFQATGKADVPRQQTVLTIDSADLPLVLQGGFKWFFRLNALGPSTHNGWQFESIAVTGSR